jgi:hypothetical protein
VDQVWICGAKRVVRFSNTQTITVAASEDGAERLGDDPVETGEQAVDQRQRDRRRATRRSWCFP